MSSRAPDRRRGEDGEADLAERAGEGVGEMRPVARAASRRGEIERRIS